ncbi:MAG: SURF1 family protein [Acidimicrobiales bacterium]|nr:SURF1 family protein [Acidimicrobiales bacterium]
MSRYRFALSPRWIVSHLFVLALVVAMVSAGLWQLRRLDEKRDRNDVVEARTAQAEVDVEGLADPGDFDAAGDLQYRRVRASGEYLADEEVLVRSRSLNGAPGSWVLTPLLLDDGTAVVVNRGWISNSGALEAVPTASRAESGPVEVSGLVRLTETRGRFGAEDPAEGVLTNLARADVARLGQQLDVAVMPFFVQLQVQRPEASSTDPPKPVPAPALDEGPHLSYAVQWFIFTTVAVVGYPLILRRRAREVEIEELPDDDLAPA